MVMGHNANVLAMVRGVKVESSELISGVGEEGLILFGPLNDVLPRH